MNKILTILIVLLLVANLVFAVKVIEDFPFGEDSGPTVSDPPVAEDPDAVVCVDEASGLVIDDDAYVDKDVVACPIPADGSVPVCDASSSISKKVKCSKTGLGTLAIDEDAYKTPECDSGTELSPDKKQCVPEQEQSVVTYVKLLNKKIIENKLRALGLRGFSKTGAKNANSLIKSQAGVEGAKNNANLTQNKYSLKTVEWTDILSTETATIIFPKLEVDGVTHQLKVVFNPRNWLGVRFVQVYDDGRLINCQSGFWSTAWNGLWVSNSMVLGWIDEAEPCEEPISGFYILEATVTGQSRKNLTLNSPLIPQACSSVISQSAAGPGYISSPSC